MGDLYPKKNCLSLNSTDLFQLFFFFFVFKTVIIFISFVSHDLNFRIRFRRFANDFVCVRDHLLLCHFDLSHASIQRHKQTNKKKRKYYFPEWLCNWRSIHQDLLAIVLLNEKKWKKTKSKFNLDSSDLRLLINFNRFSFIWNVVE